MIEKFEDLIVWQRSRQFANNIYFLTRNSSFLSDFDLKDQIIRSSRSIMSNIAEGYGRYTFRDYRQFLIIARGSLTETQSHLYTALDLKYLTQEEFDKFYQSTKEIYKLINGLINHLTYQNKF